MFKIYELKRQEQHLILPTSTVSKGNYYNLRCYKLPGSIVMKPAANFVYGSILDSTKSCLWRIH